MRSYRSEKPYVAIVAGRLAGFHSTTSAAKDAARLFKHKNRLDGPIKVVCEHASQPSRTVYEGD